MSVCACAYVRMSWEKCQEKFTSQAAKLHTFLSLLQRVSHAVVCETDTQDRYRAAKLWHSLKLCLFICLYYHMLEPGVSELLRSASQQNHIMITSFSTAATQKQSLKHDCICM